MFLQECKYALKKKKIINKINEELDLDESDDEPDNDKSNKSDKIKMCSKRFFNFYGFNIV